MPPAIPSAAAVLAQLKLSGLSLVDVPPEGIELVERTLRASGRTASAAMILSTDQLMWGLYLLSLRHQRQQIKEVLPGTHLRDSKLLAELLRDTVLAQAAYADSKHDLLQRSGLDAAAVVSFTSESTACRPAYFVAVDHSAQRVLLCIRGTRSKFDVLTDLHAESAPLEDGGYAHTGMLEAARWFMKHESKHLTELMQRHPTYQLKVLGHSLGAGTAALLTMLVRAGSSAEEQGAVMDAAMRARVSCTAVATPPCLSYDLAVATAPYVTSVVLDDDVIPRTSLVSLYNMQVETLETDWRTDIPEGKLKKDFLTAIETAHKALQQKRTESMKSVDALAGVLRQKSLEYLKGSVVPQPHPQLTRVMSRAVDAAAALSTSAKAYEPRTSLGVMLKNALLDQNATQAPTEQQHATEQYPAVPGIRTTHAPPPTQIALFSPGRLLHVVSDRDGDGDGGGVRVIDGFPGVAFQRICLSKTMLTDHKTESYVAALTKAAAATGR